MPDEQLNTPTRHLTRVATVSAVLAGVLSGRRRMQRSDDYTKENDVPRGRASGPIQLP